MEVTLLRLAFILLDLASGIEVLLYVLLWMLLPGESTAGRPGRYRDVVRENLSAMGGDLRRSASAARVAWQRADADDPGWPRPLSRRWIAIGLIGAGLFIFLYSLGAFAWLGPGRTLGLALAAVGAAVLASGAPDLRRR